MSDNTRHYMSFALRTMSGLVNRRVLDEAADELDRLNTLVVHMTEQASALHNETKRQMAVLQARIKELEHALAINSH
jgi:hypothetical protein